MADLTLKQARGQVAKALNLLQDVTLNFSDENFNAELDELIDRLERLHDAMVDKAKPPKAAK